MTRKKLSSLKKQRLRWDFNGVMTDSAYFLMKDWLKYEQPTPGHSVIAHRLNVLPSTITYWAKRNLPPSAKPRPTPPIVRHVTPSMLRRLMSIARETTIKTGVKVSKVRRSRTERQVVCIKYPTIKDITVEFNLRTGESMKEWTVRRALKKAGFRNVKRVRAPYLSEEHKRKRLLFCTTILNKGIPADLAFSDETTFDTNNHEAYQWVGPGDIPLVQFTVQGGAKLMVWIVIGKGFKKIVLFPEGTNEDAAAYVKFCLQPNLALLKTVTLQQDNARPHTANSTLAWMAQHKIRLLDPQWEAYSPDLSPVEKVNAILKKGVSQHAPYSYEDLCRCVKLEFEKIAQSTIDNLIDGFEHRLRQCRALKGDTVQ